MEDDLIPKSNPNKGGNKTSADENTSDGRTRDPQENLPPPHQHETRDSESSLAIVGVLFLFIEAIAWVLWQIADGVTGWICIFVHWLSLVALSLGPFPALLKVTRVGKRLWFWAACSFIWLLLALLAFVIWQPAKPAPKPHFIVSLQLGDSSTPTVLLTNESFFRAGMVNVIKETNHYFLFNGVANGCVVIPVQVGESNKVLQFIVENDSPTRSDGVEVIVGFPLNWKLGFDPTKWERIGEHLIASGWKLQITNLQFLATESHRSLSFTEMLGFPAITNFNIPPNNNPSNQVGFFNLAIRSSGDLLEFLSANLYFLRVESNTFKPFVTTLKPDTNGVWRVSMSQKEFEDSQK